MAAEMALKNKAMHFDMSGITWRMIEQHYLGPEEGQKWMVEKLRMTFWHPDAWGGMVFGTDGGIGRRTSQEESITSSGEEGEAVMSQSIKKVLQRKGYYREWLETLKVPEEIQYKIMYDNAAELFGLPPRVKKSVE